MARKSRKNVEAAVSAASVEEVKRPFRAGIYARISTETEYTQEVGTIDTQVELIRNYIKDADDISEITVYKDANYSGTNFDRPGFQQMMADIKSRKINCVIVKDLSRLGRNYVESCTYIEKVFPFFDIRFIAVTDDFDSFRKGTDLTVPFKNIVNELYSRDLGKKSKSAKVALWKAGKNTGNVPYGYKKDPEDKYHIIIDDEAAAYVKEIFERFIHGDNYSAIARNLTERDVLTPAAYRQYCRDGKVEKTTRRYWIGEQVRTILVNRYYTGDSIHGRETSSRFKKERRHCRTPESEWMIIENTHEPLVEKDLFVKVQQRVLEVKQASKAKSKQNSGRVRDKNILAGKIFCSGCGKRMTLSYDRWQKDYYYECGQRSLRSVGISKCAGHYIKKSCIESAALNAVQAHMKSALHMESVIRKVNAGIKGQEKFREIENEISRIRREISRITRRKAELYEDYTDRLINEEEYLHFSENYSVEITELNAKLEHELEMRVKYSQNFQLDKEWKRNITAFIAKRKMTEEMAQAFVDYIIVHSTNEIEVRLKYDDLYKELLVLYAQKEEEVRDA